MLKELALTKRFPILLRNHQTTADKILCCSHRVVTFKLQDHAVLMKPVIFDLELAGGAIGHPDIDLVQGREPVRKIGFNRTRDLTTNPSRLDYSRDDDLIRDHDATIVTRESQAQTAFLISFRQHAIPFE